MSSATSSFAQVSRRTKFLLTVADISGYVIDGLNSTMATSVELESFTALSKVSILPNTLLKDLGRQIVLYDDETAGTKSPHIATFRQVQLVKGDLTEGVSGYAPGLFDGQTTDPESYYNTCYVCVSSEDQTAYPVRVVRTG